MTVLQNLKIIVVLFTKNNAPSFLLRCAQEFPTRYFSLQNSLIFKVFPQANEN